MVLLLFTILSVFPIRSWYNLFQYFFGESKLHKYANLDGVVNTGVNHVLTLLSTNDTDSAKFTVELKGLLTEDGREVYIHIPYSFVDTIFVIVFSIILSRIFMLTISNPQGRNVSEKKVKKQKLKYKKLLQAGNMMCVNKNDIIRKDDQKGTGKSFLMLPIKASNYFPGGSERKLVDNCCAICLVDYVPSDRVVWSIHKNCTHAFHYECMIEWTVANLRKSRITKCPCCRMEFYPSMCQQDVKNG